MNFLRSMKYFLAMGLSVLLIAGPGLGDEISPEDKEIIRKDAEKANWVTKLLTAARENNTDLVEEIVKSAEFNPSVTMTYEQGNTGNVPLTTLVYTASVVAGGDKSAQVLRIVLDAGGDPNAGDANGDTPLHMAVGFRTPAAVHLLLDHGADPNIKNHSGRSALDVARLMKRDRMVKILEDGGNLR